MVLERETSGEKSAWHPFDVLDESLELDEIRVTVRQ
jgi:hypothetical protein